MKITPKAGLLIITLVIPALIFTFLKVFTRNHYSLPYFNPEKNSKGDLIIQKGDTLFHAVDGALLLGDSVKLEGELNVIAYIPADCADSCDLLIEQLTRIASVLQEIDDSKILLLSGNQKIASELPERVKGRLLSLGDDKISTFFKTELGMQGFKPNQLNEVVLTDRTRKVRGYYNLTQVEETDRLMAEIKILAYEEKSD